MIVDVGDAPVLVWRITDPDTGQPVDADSVTVSLTPPTGSVIPLTPVNAGPGVWQVTAPITAAGAWRLRWTSVGPAQQDEVGLFAVGAGESAPWAPDLRRVGGHIPSRTRSLVSNDPLGTFTADTAPTGEEVSRIISSAVAMVAGMVGTPIVPAAFRLCETAAALWAAYWVELSAPERDADVSVYGRLRDDALLLTEQAKAVNLGAGGGNVDPPDGDGVPDRLVSFSFPCPGPPLVL